MFTLLIRNQAGVFLKLQGRKRFYRVELDQVNDTEDSKSRGLEVTVYK